MTTLLKNASYLKVSHSGQTTGSLLLADLADEENAKQEKKIPVYVPEGGSITLPLDEDVLLSYQQGTIRGLEDQGFITTTLLDQPTLDAEYWVSTNGDDTNSGTKESPYATVAKAVQDIQADFGDDVQKVVKIMPGTYTETERIVIWRQKMELVNASDEDMYLFGDTLVEIDASHSDPVIFISNLTEESANLYLDNGGPSYTITSSSFSYDGPDIIDAQYDVRLDPGSFVYFNTTMRGIQIRGSNAHSLAAITFGSGNLGFGFNLDNVRAANGPVFKNMMRGTLEDCRMPYTGSSDHFILDNVILFSFIGGTHDDASFANIAWRIDQSVDATEGSVFTSTSNLIGSSDGELAVLENLYLFGSDSVGFNAYATNQFSLSVEGNVVVNGDVDFNPGHLYANNLTLETGTGHVLKNAVITNDLTVNSPAAIELTNCVVKNNLEGTGDITMNGGGYVGANNNTGTFTYNALGTT